MGRDAQRDALRGRAGLRRAAALSMPFRITPLAPPAAPIVAASAARLVRLQLTRGTVVADGLEEQVHDADALGDGEHPPRPESKTAMARSAVAINHAQAFPGRCALSTRSAIQSSAERYLVSVQIPDGREEIAAPVQAPIIAPATAPQRPSGAKTMPPIPIPCGT